MDKERDNEDIYKLVRENNRMLKGMRSRARWNIFFRFLYALIIIAVIAVSYILIKPFIDQTRATIDLMQAQATAIQNAGSSLDFGNVFDFLPTKDE